MPSRTIRAVAAVSLSLISASCAAVNASPSTSSPSPSQALPTSTPAADFTWSAEPFPGYVQGLTADRGQLVAVGRDGQGLASWTSSDGVEWERHSVPDPSFIKDMDDASLYDGTSTGQMTKLSETLFSFGGFSGPGDFYRPVAWRSADGVSWEFIESQSEFYSYGAVGGVRTMGDALLAARVTGLIAPRYDLWRWTDKTSWQRSDVRSTDDVVIVSMNLAVDDGSAFIVGGAAVPTDAPEDEWQSDPMAWHSTDGQHWVQVEGPIDAALACGVAASPAGGFVMVGESDDQQLSAWSTIDGTAWTRSDLAAVAHLQGCGDVVSAGDRLLVTGVTPQGARIWLSHDGLSWEVQDIPEIRNFVGQVAILNGELFVPASVDAGGTLQNVLLQGIPSR
jgi:hypothetical protein